MIRRTGRHAPTGGSPAMGASTALATTAAVRPAYLRSRLLDVAGTGLKLVMVVVALGQQVFDNPFVEGVLEVAPSLLVFRYEQTHDHPVGPGAGIGSGRAAVTAGAESYCSAWS